MKKIFILLVLSSIVPLCAMEREADGDTNQKACFERWAWQGYIQDLQEQLLRLRGSRGSINEYVAVVYDDILRDARQGTLPNAETTLQFLQKDFEMLRAAKRLPHSASAPADPLAVQSRARCSNGDEGREKSAGGATVVAANGDGAGSQGAGSPKPPILKPESSPEEGPEGLPRKKVTFRAMVDVAVFSEDERVEDLLPESSDEDSEGDSGDSAASDDLSSGEEDEEGDDALPASKKTYLLTLAETKRCDASSLWDRIYKLWKKMDITDLEHALDAPDAKFDDVEAMIAEREEEFGASSSEEEEESLSSGEEDAGGEGPADSSGSESGDGSGDSEALAELSSADEEGSDAVLPSWAAKPRDGDAPSDEGSWSSGAGEDGWSDSDGEARAHRDEDGLSSAEEVDIIGGPPTPASSPVQDDAAGGEEDGDLERVALDAALPYSPFAAGADSEEEEEESGDDEPELLAVPAAAADAAVDPYEGYIGDLDEIDAEADRSKRAELAGRLSEVGGCPEVPVLRDALGIEGTDLEVLERQIATLEERIRRAISSPSPRGKAGTASSNVGRGWWRNPPASFLKITVPASITAFVVGGLGYITHRHVKKQRALGKPTVFDRMRSTSKQWKKKVERLVRRPVRRSFSEGGSSAKQVEPVGK